MLFASIVFPYILIENILTILLFKSTIFSLSEIKTTSLFSLVTLRVVVDFLTLASWLYYILE